MSINAKKVLVGAPDQLTTGAVLCAPVGTDLPDLDDMTPSAVTLASAFKSSGYVSEDGVTLTPDYSTTDIKEWGGALVRRILEGFTGEIAFKLIQTDEESLKMAFGDDNVTAAEADATHGSRLKVAIGAHLPGRKSWVFKMKDGDARILILVPDGQVTAVDEITFAATDAVGYSVTISCYRDDDGESIYILTDDGAVSA